MAEPQFKPPFFTLLSWVLSLSLETVSRSWTRQRFFYRSRGGGKTWDMESCTISLVFPASSAGSSNMLSPKIVIFFSLSLYSLKIYSGFISNVTDLPDLPSYNSLLFSWGNFLILFVLELVFISLTSLTRMWEARDKELCLICFIFYIKFTNC